MSIDNLTALLGYDLPGMTDMSFTDMSFAEAETYIEKLLEEIGLKKGCRLCGEPIVPGTMHPNAIMHPACFEESERAYEHEASKVCEGDPFLLLPDEEE